MAQPTLDDIIATKQEEVARRKESAPLSDIIAATGDAPAPRDFAGALVASEDVALIAEVKRQSPSKGLLCPGFDPAATAREYAKAGASAISCLTDEHYFGGRLEYVKVVHESCDLPVLRKDFILDPYQVYESRAAGADAVLLIAAVLPVDRLRELHELAESLGMAALVEVHNEAEAHSAVDAGAKIIGINNRNLQDFTVDTGTTARLRPIIPEGVIVVSESGIRGPEDVRRLRQLGVDAMLVGEHLMTASDRGAAVRSLTAGN